MGERRVQRRCAGAVDAVGVARGEMGEDLLDEFGGFDARDDAQRAATHATVFGRDPGGGTEGGRGGESMMLPIAEPGARPSFTPIDTTAPGPRPG